jgi:hypothetical protein
MATMTDLDKLALAMPQATKEVSDDGRPTYLVHGKFFCFHRSRRRDAVDPDTGERLDDVLVFRVADVGVKELMLADDRGIFFTTPHWNGYSAVLIRIPDLGQLDRDELEDAVVEAWLTRAQKRVAKAGSTSTAWQTTKSSRVPPSYLDPRYRLDADHGRDP